MRYVSTAGVISYAGSFILLVFSYCISLIDPSLSDALFYYGFVALLIGTIFAFACNRRWKRRTAVQIACISGSLLFFWAANLQATIAAGTAYNQAIAWMGLIALACTFLAWMWIWIRCRFRECGPAKSNTGKGKTGAGRVKEYALLFAAMSVFTILYAPTFRNLFRGDSYVYFAYTEQYIGTWGFSLSDIIGFHISQHVTYGWSLFVIPLRILFGRDGYRLCNLFLILTSAVALFEISKRVFSERTCIFHTAISVLYLFHPLILGINQELSTDLPMLCFFLWLVWAYLYEYRVYTAFFPLLLVYSKEVGVVLLGGLAIGIVIGRIIRKEKWNRLVRPNEWLAAFAAILFLISMNVLNYSWQAENTFGTQRAVGRINTLQVNPSYISFKLEEMCLLNFQWLATGLIIVLALILLYRRWRSDERHARRDRAGSFFCIILATPLLFMTVFQLFYFTYPNYRYLIYIAPYTSLVIGWLYNRLVERNAVDACNAREGNGATDKQKNSRAMEPTRKVTQYVVFSMLVACFIAQSFIQIDPISNAVFERVDTGNGQIISLAEFGSMGEDEGLLVHSSDGVFPEERLRDYIHVDRQYLDIQRCFEKAMDVIQPGKDTGLILETGFHKASLGDFCWTSMNLFGCFDPRDLTWNPKKHMIGYAGEGTPIHWMTLNDPNVGNYEELWLIATPFAEDERTRQFLKNRNILEAYDVIKGVVRLQFYRITV